LVDFSYQFCHNKCCTHPLPPPYIYVSREHYRGMTSAIASVQTRVFGDVVEKERCRAAIQPTMLERTECPVRISESESNCRGHCTSVRCPPPPRPKSHSYGSNGINGYINHQTVWLQAPYGLPQGVAAVFFSSIQIESISSFFCLPRNRLPGL